jgi:ribosomal protein L44E
MEEYLNSCKKETIIKVEEYHKKRKKKKEKLDWYQRELERKYRKLKNGKRVPYYMSQIEFKFKQKIEHQKEIWVRGNAVDDNKEFSDEKKKYFEEKFGP